MDQFVLMEKEIHVDRERWLSRSLKNEPAVNNQDGQIPCLDQHKNSVVNSVFELASGCLHTASVDRKLESTQHASELLARGQIDFSGGGEPLPITATVFPVFPELVDPRQLPRRSVGSENGRVALLHALAHIEFYAIHLAWDIVYRFRGLPAGFYKGWLEVAVEESMHFSLLCRRLGQLGAQYGDLPAHRGLWDIATDTCDDLLARLALVPRTMEARGLDVTPGMIEKLSKVGDERSVAILQRILADEVGHVALGSRWFKKVCYERGLDPVTSYIEFVQRFLKGKIRRPINHALRRQAGFDEQELKKLELL